VDLGVRPTPVEEHAIDGLRVLVKRDDKIGGNKMRCLEFLLTGSPKRLLTYSTLSANHALATARAGRKLGIETDVVLVGPPHEIVQQKLHFAACLLGRELLRVLLFDDRVRARPKLGEIGCGVALEGPEERCKEQ